MGLGIKIPRNALAKGAADYAENPNKESYTPEPGTYLGVIKRLKGVDSKGGQLVADIAIGGELEDESARGKEVSLWFSFEPERIIFLFRFLAMLGYDVEDLDAKKLEEHAEAIEAAEHVVRFRCFEKDGYINTKIQKVMTELTAAEVNAGEGAAPDTEGSASDGAGKVGAGTNKGKPAKKKPAPAADDLDSLDKKELKALIVEEELEIEFTPKMDEDDLRPLIREAREAKEGAQDDSTAGAVASDDLEDMDRKALKAIVVAEELEIAVTSKMDDDALREAIREARTAKGEGGATPAADEGEALTVGAKVSFKVKGVTHKGTVQKIDYENGKVTIKSKTDGKLYNEVPDKLSPG